MRPRLVISFVFIAFAILIPCCPASAASKKQVVSAAEREGTPVLWTDPADITSRNLYFGPGGPKDQPHGPFTYIKEDLDGTNPKFDVRDADGMKWKVKLGDEARPETTATRLVWAVGYYTNEDYFLPNLQVAGMPAHLHRGEKLIARYGSTGTIQNVRLKREPKNEKNIGEWPWRSDPFAGTKQYNGLRVMMALINNWDLKDENNSVYHVGHEDIYMVSDLGASFGTIGDRHNHALAKGNIESYRRSRFITRITPTYVDFATPARASFTFLVNPKEYFMRLGLRWIGRKVPVEDVRWMAQILVKLSDRQIQDAFRAAGYSPREIEEFAGVVEERIAELNNVQFNRQISGADDGANT